MDVAEDTVSALLTCLDEDADSLVGIVRLKPHEDYACMHSVAVCALMAGLARQLGFSSAQRRQVALAGLLHDIGKAFVPARVLSTPGKLTEDEFAVVRTHPQHGLDLLNATADVAEAVKETAHQHHERPDGRGYPRRLRSDQIAPVAKMGAICDVYDAVTSNRPYKDGWDPATTLSAMSSWAQSGQFDIPMMSAFQDLMGTYPMGSLVRLRSERLAVVNAKLPETRKGLSVTAFHCLRSDVAIDPEIIHVGTAAATDDIVGSESNAKWRFPDLDRLWASQVDHDADDLYVPGVIGSGWSPFQAI